MKYFSLKTPKLGLSIVATALIIVQAALIGKEFSPKNIPEYAAKSKIVRRVFNIQVPGFNHCYNPSIIPTEKGYLLAFRHDDPHSTAKKSRVFIGVVELDHDFAPMSLPHLLETGNEWSEDPRLFAANDAIYVSHSHVTKVNPVICCMQLSKLDPKTLQVVQHTDLKYQPKEAEKNWTPFVYSKDSKQKIYYVYEFLPHRILEVDPSLNGEAKVAYKDRREKARLSAWEKRWGPIYGSTPAIQLENRYLSLFHTRFLHEKTWYYVFGAMLFEAKPPFRILKMSKEPIFFKGIYETPVPRHIWFYPWYNKKVIFPSGIVAGKEKGRDVFYVVCGENDVAIKCLVIDKKHLLDSLKDV